MNSIVNIARRQASSGGGASITYPADTFSDMSFAFGLIKASSSYSGDCLEIQRDSDGAYNTVGWKADGTADLSGVLSWAGTDTVNVTEVYDSTGNGNTLVNTTAASQVILASGGSLNLYDNQLFMNDKFYQFVTGGTNTPINAPELDLYTVYTPQLSSGQFTLAVTNANINNGFSLLAQDTTTTSINLKFGSPIYYQDGALKSWANRITVKNEVIVPLTRTQLSILGGDASQGISKNSDLRIGGSNFGFKLVGGKTLWAWVTDTSSERSAIEAMINEKVNITI
jgi:hypothetical protein